MSLFSICFETLFLNHLVKKIIESKILKENKENTPPLEMLIDINNYQIINTYSFENISFFKLKSIYYKDFCIRILDEYLNILYFFRFLH